MTGGKSFSGRERNCCFLNTSAQSSGEGRFANVSSTSGLDYADDGRSIVSLDWDNDGDLDLWTTNRNAPRIRFMKNNLPKSGHFIAVKLVGDGRTTNRDAIGARVEILTEPDGTENHKSLRLSKTLRAGEGFQSQSSKWLHFGLGESTKDVSVIIRWPNAGQTITEFESLAIDRRYILEQNSSHPSELQSTQETPNLIPSDQDLPLPTAALRIPCIVRLPVVDLPYTSLDSSEPKTLRCGNGRSTLVSLWSSNCSPCLKELTEFTQRASDLREKEIDVVALCVDEMVADASSSAAAITFLDDIGFPFKSGAASTACVSYFQRLYGYLTPLAPDFPLPTSFLIDSSGNLAYVYKGSVSIRQVIEDATDMITTPNRRFEIAAALPGRSIDHPIVHKKMRDQEFKTRFRFADDLRSAKRFAAAIKEYQAVIRLDPQSASAHNNLGLTLRAVGQLDAAKKHYESALRLESTSAETHNNLGVVLMKQRDFDSAMMHFRQALHFRPKYIEALMNLGIACEQTKEFARSIACFEYVLTLHPDHTPAMLQLGIIAEKQNRFRQAVAFYENALLQDSENADAHHNLGVVVARLGNVAKGIHHLEEAIRISPRRADAHNNLGLLFESQNELLKATECYQRAIEIDPSYSPARRNLLNVKASQRQRP